MNVCACVRVRVRECVCIVPFIHTAQVRVLQCGLFDVLIVCLFFFAAACFVDTPANSAALRLTRSSIALALALCLPIFVLVCL